MNIVHSIDGYIVREMVRRANQLGFQLTAIHDSFWCSPVYMNETRRLYKEILAEIADSNLLVDILSEITSRNDLTYTKKYRDLSKYILDSEYALS